MRPAAQGLTHFSTPRETMTRLDRSRDSRGDGQAEAGKTSRVLEDRRRREQALTHLRNRF